MNAITWISTTTSPRESSFEKYMEAKVSLIQLEQEKTLLITQMNIAEQYLVFQLLMIQDPLQNAVVQSTAEHIKDNTNRITEIVCTTGLL